jgi:hypothetical protein
MRTNFPFRHGIAVIAVVVDVSLFALIHIIPLYVVPADEIFLNSDDHSLYFLMVNVWGWLHVPVAWPPIGSPVFCYESCHVIGFMRNTIHIILFFMCSDFCGRKGEKARMG